jgi:DNA anti-recombination protein RmuC
MKKQMDDQMSFAHGELSNQNSTLAKDLRTLETRMVSLAKELPKAKDKIDKDFNKVVIQIFKEVKRIESLIPTVDLEPLQDRISEVERKIPKIPSEITAKQTRDKLETLKGESRLDVSAVNSAAKMTVSRTAPSNPQIGDLWGNPFDILVL